MLARRLDTGPIATNLGNCRSEGEERKTLHVVTFPASPFAPFTGGGRTPSTFALGLRVRLVTGLEVGASGATVTVGWRLIVALSSTPWIT